MDQLVCKATNVAFKHLQQSTMIFDMTDDNFLNGQQAVKKISC